MGAAESLANAVKNLSVNKIIPNPFEKGLVERVVNGIRR